MVGILSAAAVAYQSPKVLLVAVGALLLLFVAYRLLFSPLAKIPGPWITSLTSLWLMYHEFLGDRTEILDALHSKYGDIVRVSPTEVSFNNAEALKDIYGIKSGYSKSHFYDMFVYYDERNTFTSLDKPNVSSILFAYHDC
jgi:hypothetical protein